MCVGDMRDTEFKTTFVYQGNEIALQLVNGVLAVLKFNGSIHRHVYDYDEAIAAIRELSKKESKIRANAKKRENETEALLRVVKALNKRVLIQEGSANRYTDRDSHIKRGKIEKYRITPYIKGVSTFNGRNYPYWVHWNTRINKFRLSEGYYGAGSWLIPSTVLKRMGEIPQIRKIMADPEFMDD